MIYMKNRHQPSLFDQWNHLGPKRRALLDNSWAGLFKEEVLKNLPVEELARFYSFDQGRPTKDLYTALGTVLLQQMHDLSDEETVQQLAFNIQWHYALDITSMSDSSAYICQRTLLTTRQHIIENKLDTLLFDKVTKILAKAFDVDTDNQRIDSVHIKSNMRKLSRIGIFVSTIRKFLINLKRQHKDSFKTVPEKISKKYLSKKELSCFSLVKPSDSHKILEDVAFDLLQVVSLFSSNEAIKEMHSYQLLCRVAKEQCTIQEAETSEKTEILKPSKEISSDSLQNPSDPDAAYSGHKGQGYQAQVMETYRPGKEEGPKKPNLITHVAVEPANESDASALIPAIDAVKEQKLAPKEVLADSLYGSDENCEAASAKGVDVVSPTLGTVKEGIALSDFKVSKENLIESCPCGIKPLKQKVRADRHSVMFDAGRCETCPVLFRCSVKKGKRNNYYLRYDIKAMRLAQRRCMEKKTEFIEKYRFRAGIEATFSHCNTLTGIKKLRVRGLSAVRFCVTLKALAVNIFRATAARKALAAIIHLIYCLKEQVYAHLRHQNDPVWFALQYPKHILLHT